MINGTIAIVGRPNVGKSTLFNRMLEERLAIVEDVPGVTRDRLYGDCQWLSKTFRVIDTGGIQLEDEPFQKEIKAQVELAIDEADVVVMVVNGREGVTNDDEYIARLLQKSNKKVVLAVNKIDDYDLISDIYDFYRLGMDDPIPVSAIHGIGIGDLLDKCTELMPDETIDEHEGSVRFAIIGRPNVGKSSLTNAFLNQERVIVSNIAGTTRDAIDTAFVVDGKNYAVVDTAGIRKRGKVYESVEKYSVLRSKNAIDRADVILVVLDGETGIIEQDKHVAGLAHEALKGVIIVYNKWDTVEKDDKTINEVTLKIRNEFTYLSYAPIIFVSAKTKQRVKDIIPMINDVYNYATLRIDTSILNEVIMDAQMQTPAPAINGKRFKILYATQVSTMPPTFVLSVNDPKLLHFSYRRYLENKIREAFGFDGTPIRIIARKKG